MKKRYLSILCVIASFLLGVYVWRVKNTGKRLFGGSTSNSSEGLFDEDLLAEVAEERIYLEDVDFENKLLTKDLQQDISSIMKLEAASTEKEKQALKSRIFDSLIERKILYKYLLQDKEFNSEKAERLEPCLKRWNAVKGSLKEFPESDIDRLKVRLCEQSIIEQYCKERIFSQTDPKDEDLLKYYHEHESKFKRPAQVKIRQIVLATEKNAQWVKERINKGNFSQMAETYSISPDGKKGGVLGPYGKGDLPQVFESAFLLPVGQISEIFKSTYGFHVFIVDEKHGPRKLSFEESKHGIKDTLLKERQSLAFKDWVEVASRSVQVRIMRSLQ